MDHLVTRGHIDGGRTAESGPTVNVRGTHRPVTAIGREPQGAY